MLHLSKSISDLLRSVYSLKAMMLNGKRCNYGGKVVFYSFIGKLFPSNRVLNAVQTTILKLNESERFPANFSVKINELFELENKLRIRRKTKQLNELLKHRIALQYRLGRVNGGVDPRILGYVEYGLLTRWAKEWKSKQDIYRDKSLKKEEKRKLKVAAQFSLFVDLLLEDKTLKNEFFQWVLRDGNNPEIFIEFPSITEWIIRSDLNMRLGRIGNLLHIKEIGGVKQVTLKFEGKTTSICDPNTVVEFRGSYKKTISEIFESFSKKYKEVGDFEVFQDGVINWNTFKMGYWNDSIKEYVLVDFIRTDWWKELPHFETLTEEQVKERYGIDIDGVSWVSAVSATRANINLSYEETHAFIELAIPDGQGRYHIYDFGKYGKYFPKNVWDGLKKFTLTMLACVMYPDENVYYSHRQHGYYPFVISQKEGINILSSIRDEIFKCMAGQSVYQIESENCAKWTVELLKNAIGSENIPNLYRMSLLDCEPGGAMQKVFNLIKKLPNFLHVFSITRLHYPIGAWRGVWIKKQESLEWKSLSKHQFFHTAEVYLPALVIKKRDEGLFEIRTANPDGQTLWSLVLEKVLHRVSSIKFILFRQKLKIAWNILFLLTYIDIMIIMMYNLFPLQLRKIDEYTSQSCII